MIAIGAPYGVSGLRLVGDAPIEGKRRRRNYVTVTVRVGGGVGAAGLFEVARSALNRNGCASRPTSMGWWIGATRGHIRRKASGVRNDRASRGAWKANTEYLTSG